MKQFMKFKKLHFLKPLKQFPRLKRILNKKSMPIGSRKVQTFSMQSSTFFTLFHLILQIQFHKT